MSSITRTEIVYDDRYLLHETGKHPERKERLNISLKGGFIT